MNAEKWTHSVGGNVVYVEAYYAGSVTRDYGELDYGDEIYGDSIEIDPTPTWHDITCAVISTDIVRGDSNGGRVVPVDQMIVQISDDDGIYFPFTHAGNADLATFGVGDPIRVRVARGDNADDAVVATLRIERISDRHDSIPRIVTIEAVGFANDGVYLTELPTEPEGEIATDRFGRLVGLLPITLPEQVFGPTFADIVPSLCYGRRSLVRSVRGRLDDLAATMHGAYSVDPYGVHRVIGWPYTYDADTAFTVTDCVPFDPGRWGQATWGNEVWGTADPVVNAINYLADESQLITLALAGNREPGTGNQDDDAVFYEREDSGGIARYGRRSQALGMPAITESSEPALIELWLQNILDRFSTIVNRVASVDVDARLDYRWPDILPTLDIGSPIDVVRSADIGVDRYVTYRSVVVGIRHVITAPPGPFDDLVWQSTIYLQTIEST